MQLAPQDISESYALTYFRYFFSRGGGEIPPTTLTSPMFGSVADPARGFLKPKNIAPRFEPLPQSILMLCSYPLKKIAPCGAYFLKSGEGEIRTLGTVSRTPHFECGAFDHSATSPLKLLHIKERLSVRTSSPSYDLPSDIGRFSHLS